MASFAEMCTITAPYLRLISGSNGVKNFLVDPFPLNLDQHSLSYQQNQSQYTIQKGNYPLWQRQRLPSEDQLSNNRDEVAFDDDIEDYD